MRIAIITGASGGLGAVFAARLADDPAIDELWLCGRNAARLQAVADALAKPSRLFIGDLQKEEDRLALAEALREQPAHVHRLVNAAGYGTIGPFRTTDRADVLGQVELNCLALADLTYLLLPYMERGDGIIQISSVASFLPQTYFALYAASKAFVSRFSLALAEELAPSGIRVIAVCPNPMDTGFFDRAGAGKGAGFKRIGFESPERVVDAALARLEKGRRLSVTHPAGYLLALMGRILPHRVVTLFERLFF